MLSLLRGLLMILGVSAIGIGASILAFGPTQVSWTFEHAYDAISTWRGQLSARWAPTMDSELRFYAPLFAAFGVLCLRAAYDARVASSLTPWLALVFFIGGLGRAVSWLAVGAPHPLFVMLMWIELVLPPILLALWLGRRPRP
jgi:hypothetical protein